MKKVIALQVMVPFVLAVAGCGGSDTPPGGSTASSSSSSSGSNASSSSSSSSGNSQEAGSQYTIMIPLDAFEGLLPYTRGGGFGTTWGSEVRSGKFSDVFAAINVGASEQATSLPNEYFFDVVADQHFTGGNVVDRNALVNQQEAILVPPRPDSHAIQYRGNILDTSRTARTGTFTYEIPVPESTVALEIHIVPLTPEPYIDIPFSISVENEPTIETTFTSSTFLDEAYLQGITFYELDVTDGSVSVSFDLPEDYFGVSFIFVADSAQNN